MLWRSLIFLCLGCGLGIPTLGAATGPELSADRPISFDAGRGVLIAEGNARFEHEDILVIADEIRFNRAEERVTATGNVQVTRAGLRLVTHQLTYDLKTRYFTSGPFRAGHPPIFFEGASFEGTLDLLSLRNSSVFLREPDPYALSLQASDATLKGEDTITASGVRLGLPWGWSVPLPQFERSLSAAGPAEFSGNVGFRKNLGAFGRSTTLFPVTDTLSAGANLDLYSARGVLIGPALRYRVDSDEQYTDLRLSTGWIYDTGNRGEDLFDQPIDRHRGFGMLSFRTEVEALEISGRTQFLTDSETTRDFRPSIYSRDPAPDSYLEVIHLWEDRFLSLFLRRSPNDFYGMTERLPELSIQQPLRSLGETGAYHAWDATYLRYRITRAEGIADEIYPSLLFSEGDDSLLASIFNDYTGDPDYLKSHVQARADVNYAVQYPIALSNWAQFVPRAGGRYTFWRPESRSEGSSASRTVGELGFDLTLHAFSDWNVQNRTWRIDGLRHLMRPVLQARWQPADWNGTLPEENRLDRRLYTPLIPTLDLRERRDVDMIDTRRIFRAGVENRLLTRDTAQGSRTLLELDLYQDLIPTVPSGADAWHGSYVELRSSPARWLELGLAQKYRTEGLSLEETRLRATIRSAERWEVTFAADFLDSVYEQYRLEGFYRVNPRFALFTGLRYDARRDELTQQVYGVRQRFGRTFELEYAVAFRQGSEREDDFSLRLGIRLLEL